MKAHKGATQGDLQLHLNPETRFTLPVFEEFTGAGMPVP
jgi:hypothetical protein